MKQFRFLSNLNLAQKIKLLVGLSIMAFVIQSSIFLFMQWQEGSEVAELLGDTKSIQDLVSVVGLVETERDLSALNYQSEAAQNRLRAHQTLVSQTVQRFQKIHDDEKTYSTTFLDLLGMLHVERSKIDTIAVDSESFAYYSGLVNAGVNAIQLYLGSEAMRNHRSELELFYTARELAMTAGQLRFQLALLGKSQVVPVAIQNESQRLINRISEKQGEFARVAGAPYIQKLQLPVEPLGFRQKAEVFSAFSRLSEEMYSLMGGSLARLDSKLKVQLSDLRIKFWRNLGLFGLAIALLFGLTSMTVKNIISEINLIVDSVDGFVDGIKKVRTDLQASTKTVMDGTHQAAAALEETSSTMAEMSSMISQTAQKAQEAEKNAGEVNSQTRDGTKSMTHMVDCMESIYNSTVRVERASVSIKSVTENEMGQISEIINEIASKTDIIHDLVLKTQLLSFNASIEAARAGQHGKGFAVVAQEVGNLAKTSGKAAEEIEHLIDNSRKQVESIIKNTMDKVEEAQQQVSDTKTKVNEGKTATTQSMSIFREISKASESILQSVGRVSEASSEQERGIQQITLAIENIDRTTQSNTMQAKETVGIAEKLSIQSQSLEASIASFEALILGRKTPSHGFAFTATLPSSSKGNARAEISDHEVDEALSRQMNPVATLGFNPEFDEDDDATNNEKAS